MRTSANSWIEVCETGEIIERDEAGRPLLIAGLLVDVTEKSSTQQFFVGVQRRLTSAFDIASDPLAILTSRGEFQLSNKSFGALLGHSSDALLDRSVLDFISADDRSEVEASLNAAWKEGAPRQFRCRVESCDFGHRFLDCSITPIDGFLYLSGRDVTEAMRTETELKRALEKAERSDSAKSTFIANVSHELRTPLNGIIGLTEALMQKSVSQSESETLALIKSSGETLSLLIEDLLDMAQIESGRLRLRPQEFKPAEIIEETCELLRAKARSKALNINVEAESTAYKSIVADKLRVRQVLTNLVSNAIKFTESGQVLVRARIVSEESQSHHLEVVVRDTGIGIPGEARERLFRRFEQADQSIGRRFGGTGLGLAISKSLVDAMGGVITLESVVGVGSTFTVRVPVEVSAISVACDQDPVLGNPNSGVEEEPISQASAQRGPPARLSVLVADDNETNWRVIRALCSGLQADMTWANDRAKAVALYAEKKYDLILMDMQMPLMDGLQATRAIREIEERGSQERTPIITLTANSESSHVDAAFSAGSDAFVRKPITTKTLFAGIAEGFARCERRMEYDVRGTS
jgi:PAS domain S-box-containing protein